MQEKPKTLKSLYEKLKDYTLTNEFETLKEGFDRVSEKYAIYVDNKTIFNRVNLLITTFDSYQRYKNSCSDEEDLLGEGWEEFKPGIFSTYIVRLIAKSAKGQIKKYPVNYNESQIYEATVNGTTFRWYVTDMGNKKSNEKDKTQEEFKFVSGLYFSEADAENVDYSISKLLESEFYKNSLLLRPKATTNIRDMGSRSNSAYEITKDDSFEKNYSSELSDKISKKLKRGIETGFKRSIMLYGPPGTGKTTAILQACKENNFRTLRIQTSDFASFDGSVWDFLVKYIKPDALIIDDIDRVRDLSSFLNLFELLSQNIGFFLTTANNISKIDAATIRPGRFDELIEVKHIDKTAVLALLAPYEHHYDLVKEWPIAWVQEFKKRIMFYGEKEAIEDISELTSRLKNLKKQYNFYYSSNTEELEAFEIPSEPDISSDSEDDLYDDEDDDGEVLIEDDNDDSYEIDEEEDERLSHQESTGQHSSEYSYSEAKEMSKGIIPKNLLKRLRKVDTQKKRFLEKKLDAIYDDEPKVGG